MKPTLLVLILITLSCKTNKPMTDKTVHKITTHLEMSKNTFQVGDTIPIKFSVQNNTNTTFEFCPWQTPLEKELTANCFEIIYKGDTLPYKGRMTKRIPPTKKDNLLLSPQETSTQTININKAYSIDKPGTYTIRFLGRPINKLPDSKSITFSIHKKTINRKEALKIAKRYAKIYLRAVNPPTHFIVDAETGHVIGMNIEYSLNPKKMIREEYIAMYGKDRGDSKIAVWEIILKYEYSRTTNSTKIEVEKVQYLTIKAQ